MKVLFCTQSESLRLFDELRRALAAEGAVDRAGFTVADSQAYGRWLGARPGFEGEGHVLLKEWEVTAAAREPAPVDLKQLATLERALGGEAGLFGAIVADRRLFMGPDCTYSQDYRRRFSDDELMRILQRGVERMQRLFDELQPDLVVGFICVTMLDYLAYLVARARGVRVLNLRPTRIGDRVSFSRHLNDPSPELASMYASLLSGQPSSFDETASAYIRRVREQHGRYEGVVRPSDRPVMRANVARFGKLGGIVSAARNYLAYRRSIARQDNHVPDPARMLWFTAVRNPRRASAVKEMMAGSYVAAEDLPSLDYAFFPLHTEPEVSLLVYGRPYVNQIEIIRMLAMSLPVGMVLIVKEHPWMVGKRTPGAYRKLLNIPRVRFADPGLDARVLIQSASLVAVVTGSVALEAAMLGRPVVTFGDCPYNLLPDTMVRRCDDPRRLPALLRSALDECRTDEQALRAYVSAVFETSESVNLYSVLLGKKNVHVEQPGAYAQEIAKLARLLLADSARPPAASAPGAATW